jgi:ribonuclease BN (tRNA processing enzyme)
VIPAGSGDKILKWASEFTDWTRYLAVRSPPGGILEAAVEIFFCGTRGSTPSPGAAYLRYGGHTSCVALAHDGAPPSLVLDAGTGLANLDRVLADAPFRGTILLGHLHWDHTHGMPFFAAGARPGHRVQILLPEQGEEAEQLLARAFSPPHFPVAPAALGEGWWFGTLEEGEHEIEEFSVLALEIPHKGGRTFGFRVSNGTSSLAYLSDHDPLAAGPGPSGLGELHPAALALAKDTDLLIHDAQLLVGELPRLSYLGHSCPEYAIGLAQAAGARRVCLFHHAPQRTDGELDELASRFAGGVVPVIMAADGLIVRMGSSAADETAPEVRRLPAVPT